jgi:hypothetical protein
MNSLSQTSTIANEQHLRRKTRAWAEKSLITGVLLLVFATSIATPGFATSLVNGFGGGSVRVAVWCNPRMPPAAPDASAFDSTGRFTSGATASIPGAPPNGAPLPAACTAGTNITGTNIPFWDTTWKGAEVAGDKTAGDGVSLLMTLVPKYYSSSYSVSVVGSPTDSTHALFTGSYSLSNSDAAFSIEWYSTNGAGVTSSQSGWTLLGSIPETLGTASGPINKLIFDPNATSDPYGISDDLVMEIDVAGTSVPAPEPGTLMCFGSGLIGAGGFLRRRLRKRG